MHGVERIKKIKVNPIIIKLVLAENIHLTSILIWEYQVV